MTLAGTAPLRRPFMANGWAFLTGIDVGWVAVLVVFSGVEIFVRARARPAGPRGTPPAR